MKDKLCRFYCYKHTREPSNLKIQKMKNLELIVFDMDGVLTDTISSWKYIHDYFNTSNERSVDEYLKGNIDDSEFIRRDAALWIENGKPIKKEKLIQILSNIPLVTGASECIENLKKRRIKTAIISAGLDILAEDVGQKLGIDYVYSNGIKSDKNGRLTGKSILQVRLMYKDQTVKRLARKLDISFNNIAAVGNSCFDIPMFEISGLSIAFNPGDDCVRKAADIVIEGKDLRKIFPHLNKYIL